jgi:undecaprenyl diphosphate synthase
VARRRAKDPLADLDPQRLPRHIAVIMDGNGRWAKQRDLPRIEGHAKGIDAVREMVRACRKLDIPYLTLYAFSTENWNRPRAEVEALFGLLVHFLRKELPELEKNEIRLRVIGRLERLPQAVRDEIADAVERTSRNTRLTMTVALSYSGRDELTEAVRRIAAEAVAGKLKPEQIDEALVAAHLLTAGMPDPDLLIRTSGERRVSNFLLWQIAYTEIYVTDVLWPDFGPEQLRAALLDFAGRERRFGQTSEQLGGAD